VATVWPRRLKALTTPFYTMPPRNGGSRRQYAFAAENLARRLGAVARTIDDGQLLMMRWEFPPPFRPPYDCCKSLRRNGVQWIVAILK